jgi:hypothetical protein
MTTNESISNVQNDQEEQAKASITPKGSSGQPAGDEQPMTKPTLLWFLVPVIVIALAVFLAR